MIRIIIYTDNRRAIKNVFAELILSTNLTELGFSDSNDVVLATKEPGLELVDRSKKVSPQTKYPKMFNSTVNEVFPPVDVNPSSAGRPNPNLDDRRLMPEASRAAGCVIELKVPKNADPSIEAGDNRIRYHVRVSLLFSWPRHQLL